MAALYLHIPFCVRKCGYCDFYSVAGRRGELPAFLSALHKEISLRSGDPFCGSETINTVFFGGGTPSLLSPESVRDLLERIRLTFRMSPDPEISMEVNPGTVNADGLLGYRRAGLNRISLGVQSFSDADLSALGRIHSSSDCRSAIRAAREAGFDNLGLDLIFGIPGQSMDSWQATLETALSFKPAHLSVYSLTVHPRTAFGRKVRRGEMARPGEDSLADLFQKAADLLGPAGYEHYEISNFARPGFRCRHNESYWTFRPYLGFGPSAHSYAEGKRFWNRADLKDYMDCLSRDKLPVAGTERIGLDKQRLEAIALGLRRKEGVLLKWIFNLPQAQSLPTPILLKASSLREDIIENLIADGIALIDNGSLKLTERGFLVADSVAAELA